MTFPQRSLVAVLSAILLTSSPTSAQLAGGQPEWYLPVTDGCRLFVKEYGHGTDTVIVLHGGWGAEHSTRSSGSKTATISSSTTSAGRCVRRARTVRSRSPHTSPTSSVCVTSSA